MKIITFEDGYTVTIDRHVVRFVHGGKEHFGHVTHWKPVPEGSPAAAFLQKNGKDIADYLVCEPTAKWMVVRAGNGVREGIQEALEEYRFREADMNRGQPFQRKSAGSSE